MRLVPTTTLLFFATSYLFAPIFAATLPSRSAPAWQPKPIEWESCGAGVPKTVDCATLAVPVDWSDPNGKKFNLALKRLRANGSSTENLLINPGGPGGSATGYIVAIAAGEYPVTNELTNHYNLIGLDPRGIGLSTPLKCDVKLWNERVSRFPKTEAEYNTLVEHNKAVGESCLKLSGNLLKHVDTISVARDHEAARQALGDEKLNLAGFSYGSQLVTQYVELFPDCVGRMILDGNLDHSGSATYTLVTEVAAYENELTRFATWCSSSKDCALYGKDVLAVWDKLVKQGDETPIPALACDGTTCRKDVTGEELRFNAQGYLIFKPLSWPILAEALGEALEGNATILSTPLIVAGQDEANSALIGERGVVCLDWGSNASLSDLLYKQQLTASIAPHTQGSTQTLDAQTRCIGWPAPVNNPPRVANIPTAPPMLMVNALYDPETSYTWAVALRDQIAGAVLLTRNGDGHTSYFLDGAAASAINTFYINGTLPAENTVVDS